MKYYHPRISMGISAKGLFRGSPGATFSHISHRVHFPDRLSNSNVSIHSTIPERHSTKSVGFFSSKMVEVLKPPGKQKRQKKGRVVFSINKNIDELRNLILAVRLLAMYWTSKFELLRGCSVPKRFSHVLALFATQWVQERVIFDLHPTFGSERMNVLII